jgi:DNA-binding NtrC family response regulator
VRALVLSPEFIAALRNYDWPGNVLELRNAVEYAVAICSGSRLLPQHLPASVTLARPRGDGDLDIESSRLVRSLGEWLDARLASDKLTYADILTEVEEYLLRDRTTLRRKCENLTDQQIKPPIK